MLDESDLDEKSADDFVRVRMNKSARLSTGWSFSKQSQYKYIGGPSVIVDAGKLKLIQYFKWVGQTIHNDIVVCDGSALEGKHSRLLRNATGMPNSSFAAAKYGDTLYLFYVSDDYQLRGLEVYGVNDWGVIPDLKIAANDRPALAVFNDALFMIFQGNTEGEVWYKIFDSNGWGNHIRITGIQMSFSPSLAVFENKLYCAFRGFNDSWIWTMVYENGQWSPHQKTSMTAEGPPSLCVHNGTLYCAYVAAGTDKLCISHRQLGEWAGHDILVGQRSSHEPALVSFNNKLHYFYLNNRVMNCTTHSGI